MAGWAGCDCCLHQANIWTLRQMSARPEGSIETPVPAAGCTRDPKPARKVLLIAYHYPPCHEGSGHLRALSFSRHLSSFGWDPIVLTACENVYAQVNHAKSGEIPVEMPIKRTLAFDVRERLSIRYKYPGLLAIPDRWSSWWFSAVPAGLKLIRRYRPDVIWATQPIPTAFWIAHTLNRLTNIPWIADFRDPIEGATDGGPLGRSARRWLERKTLHGCRRAVFTASQTASFYRERYPDLPSSHFISIPNGYDESDFADLDYPIPDRRNGRLHLVHSGTLYKRGRDPRPLFAAVAKLISHGELAREDLLITLRACYEDDYFRNLVAQMGLEGVVRVEPAVTHAESLRELCEADGLLVLQGSEFNGQIPAKIYGYLRTRRPILALLDESGDTAKFLRSAGIDTIAPIDARDDIATRLLRFLAAVRSGTAPIASKHEIARHERRARCRQLADLLDEVAAPQ